MKILKLIIVFFLVTSTFASSDKFSSIPLPQSVFIDLTGTSCDFLCVQKLLDDKLIFSFLSKYNDKDTTKTLQENYLLYGQILNVFLVDVDTGYVRLAILAPQKTIGRYALTSVNSVTAYLLEQSNEFEVQVYNSGDESVESIKKSLFDIRQDGFHHVIAIVTQSGAESLLNYGDGLNIFIPTLHSSMFPYVPANVVFGGVDYRAQIKSLNKFSNDFAILFSDGSKLGESLNEMVRDENKIVVSNTTFSTVRNDYKGFFENNTNINASTLYFNTPLVTTSLLASQTRLYKHNPFAMLSTQINYQPMFLTLTQPADRKNFFIASSIGAIKPSLNTMNSNLGNNLEYDWVNYSTSIGTEYLLGRFFLPGMHKIFDESVINSQVEYKTTVYKAGNYRFIQQGENSDFTQTREEDNDTIIDLNTTMDDIRGF
ncbi:MAG: hypothetical protein ACK5LP_09145 [Campylobacteraceae bacterium]